jgi:hypothetical protein
VYGDDEHSAVKLIAGVKRLDETYVKLATFDYQGELVNSNIQVDMCIKTEGLVNWR